MGEWGAGNLENDEAQDMLARLFDELAKYPETIVQKPELAVPDEPPSAGAMAAVELLCVLVEHAGMPPPPLTRVRAWRSAFLPSWRQGMDDTAAVDGYREEREDAITAAFDRLEGLAREAGDRT